MIAPKILKQRAQDLVPVLAERAKQTNDARRVLPETIEDFHKAGLFRMLQPARWGGHESDLETFFQVQATLAEGCPSSAWVFGVVSVHSWQLALFAEEAQRDVWGPNPKALIASSYAPTGKVEVVEGGYQLSGRWSFSSGSDNCDWIFLGGNAPEMRTFMLPRSDYEIEDNWNVAGLKGTGSKDIVVEGAFVPAYRTHDLMDGFRVTSPGNETNNATLYHVPFGQVFVRSVSTTAIGIARAALNIFVETAKTRIAAVDKAKVALDPTAQRACAEAKVLIDDVCLRLDHNARTLMEYAEEGEVPPIELRVQYRLDSANAVRRCVEAVDILFAASGGRAIFEDNPIQRFFQDIHAANAHFANRSDKPIANLGGVLLGQDTVDYFL